MTSVLGKNVFLSGPMSDDTAYFHADDFVKAHAVVKSCGARTVYNPAIQWLQYNDAPRTHEQWMHACVSELTQPKHTMNGDFATFYDVLVWPMPDIDGRFVVEHEDGTCSKAWPHELKFLDSKELFDSYCWDIPHIEIGCV